jgi:hypothetical protein
VWRFQSFVVLVFIWLGDGSRLNKSCLHDLGVSSHHCYQVSSQLLVEFISFWYHNFGSKISLSIFSFYFLFLIVSKKKKKKRKKKNSSFQSCFSKKIVLVPARKFLPFNLVSHLIQVLEPFDEFWLFFFSFFFFFELLQDYFELVS